MTVGRSTTLKAAEARLFWTAVSALRHARRENIHIGAHHDELEVIQEYTDSPLLKERIAEALAPADKEDKCGSSA